MCIKVFPRSQWSKYIFTHQQCWHHHPGHVCQSLWKLDSLGFHKIPEPSHGLKIVDSMALSFLKELKVSYLLSSNKSAAGSGTYPFNGKIWIKIKSLLHLSGLLFRYKIKVRCHFQVPLNGHPTGNSLPLNNLMTVQVEPGHHNATLEHMLIWNKYLWLNWHQAYCDFQGK